MTMKYRIWGGIVLLLVLLFAANLFLGSARIPFRAVLGILVGEEGGKDRLDVYRVADPFPPGGDGIVFRSLFGCGRVDVADGIC